MKIPPVARDSKPGTQGSARPGHNPNQQALIDTPRAHNSWRRQDPPTSFAAARSIDERKLTKTQTLVLEALKAGPAIDEEIVYRVRERARSSPQSIRSRRAELVRKGLVLDSGKRRPTEFGASQSSGGWHDALEHNTKGYAVLFFPSSAPETSQQQRRKKPFVCRLVNRPPRQQVSG